MRGKENQPGEGVENGLEDVTSGRLLVSRTEVLDVKAANGKLTLLCSEPAGRLRVRREGEEEEDSEAGCDCSFNGENPVAGRWVSRWTTRGARERRREEKSTYFCQV